MPSPATMDEWNKVDGASLIDVMKWAGIDDEADHTFIAELLGATGDEAYMYFAHMTSDEVVMVVSAERDGAVLSVLLKNRIRRVFKAIPLAVGISPEAPPIQPLPPIIVQAPAPATPQAPTTGSSCRAGK